jgi:hypothetical protein
VREYYGRISPDLVWQRRIHRLTPNPTTDRQVFLLSTDGRSRRCSTSPAGTRWRGIRRPPPRGDGSHCRTSTRRNRGTSSRCKGLLRGLPAGQRVLARAFYQVNGANPSDRVFFGGFAPGSIQLHDEAGDELTPEMQRGIVTYRLPAEEQR